MRVRDDDRGVAIQVGAAILLAFVVLAITLYQTQVVPQQNRDVEINHNQKLLGEFQDVRNAIVSLSGGGSSESVSVTLGTTYPERTIFVNPPAPSGQMRTTAAATLTVANATARGEVGDYWTGGVRNRTTRGLVYRPDYHEYASPPVTVYENSVLVNRFRSGTVLESDQRLVRDNRISLTTLQGTFQKASQTAVSVDVEAVSTSSRTVTITNDSGPIRITVPTTLSNDTWSKLLEDQYDENGGHVVGQSYQKVSGRYNRLTLTFERGETYVLQMAVAGLGTGVSDPGPAYMTAVGGTDVTVSEGTSKQLVVEVRDRYNNPVSGVDLTGSFSTARSDSEVTAVNNVTDGDGRVTLVYDPPDDVSGTTSVEDRVNVSFATTSTNVSGFDPGAPENVSFTVTVTNDDRSGLGGGGGGGTYDLGWDRSQIATEQGIESCDASGCTYNLSDDPDGTFLATANTTPAEDDVNVDFSNDNATVVTGLSPSSNTTDGTGHTSTEVSIGTTGTVNLTVASVQDVATLTLTVVGAGGGGGNSAPTARTSVPSSVDEGNTATLDGSASSDSDGTIQSYDWAVVSGPGTIASPEDTSTPNATYEAPSDVSTDTSVTVELRVTDNAGATDSASATFTVVDANNQAPTANFTYSPSEPAPGETVSFDGSSSSDPDDSVASYEWDFDGDGSTDATGATASYSYSSSGSYDATLTVTDQDGSTDTETRTVVVEAVPLISAFEPSPTGGDSDYEFVRVYFPTSTNASGWTITDGDSQTTTLPDTSLSGDVYFARDETAFESKWGIDPAKVYSLSTLLNDDGEHLLLVDPSGSVVDEAAYDSATTSNGWSITVGDAEVAERVAGSSTTYQDTNNASDWQVVSEGSFFGDTASPVVQSATLPGTPINDSEANANVQRNLTVQFNETMNQGVDPSFAFTNVTSSSVTAGSGSWVNDTTYEVPLTFSDNDVEELVGVNVSGAEDDAGNLMDPQRALSFVIDTQSPGDPNDVFIDTDPINASNQNDVNVTVVNPDTIRGDETAVVTLEDENGDTVTATKPITTAGGADTTITGINVSTLADGQITATAYVRDDVGNTGGSVTSAPATKDTVKPTISDFRATNPTGNTIEVVFNVTEPLGAANVTVTDADGNYVGSLRLSDLNQNQIDASTYEYTGTFTTSTVGTYDVTLVTATDTAGNAGTTGQTDRVVVGNTLKYDGDVAGSDGTKSGTTSVVNFNVTNYYSDEVVITDVEVTTTKGSVVNIEEFESSVSEVLVDTDGDGIANSDGDGVGDGLREGAVPMGTKSSLDDTAALSSGDSAQFQFYEFRNKGGQPVEMSGSDVTVTVYYVDPDGQTQSVTFTFTVP